jgi:hypothetical protein
MTPPASTRVARRTSRDQRGSMSRSSEWQFNLWPLVVRIGTRVVHLREAPQVANPPPRKAAGRALTSGEAISVSQLPAQEGSVLDWEAEGGSLGPSESTAAADTRDLPHVPRRIA